MTTKPAGYDDSVYSVGVRRPTAVTPARRDEQLREALATLRRVREALDRLPGSAVVTKIRRALDGEKP